MDDNELDIRAIIDREWAGSVRRQLFTPSWWSGGASGEVVLRPRHPYENQGLKEAVREQRCTLQGLNVLSGPDEGSSGRCQEGQKSCRPGWRSFKRAETAEAWKPSSGTYSRATTNSAPQRLRRGVSSARRNSVRPLRGPGANITPGRSAIQPGFSAPRSLQSRPILLP